MLSAVAPGDQETPFHVFLMATSLYFNILGLKWAPNIHSFSFHVKLANMNFTQTNCSLYYCSNLWPMWFYSFNHIFIQQLWTSGLKWDDPLNRNLDKHWKIFINELIALQNIQISRFSKLINTTNFRLWGFADASARGHGTIVYLRCKNNSGGKVTLLIAKMKVGPLKWVASPCLELSAAHLLGYF